MSHLSGLWPEDTIPADAIDCQRCGLSAQRSRIIWGEGDPDAELYVLLDNPGAREDKSGVPFVCKTRQILGRAIEASGLDRNAVYVTYILRCRPLRKYDKDSCRFTCTQYLWPQLYARSPQLVVCLGNAAAQSYLGDTAAEIKSLRGKIAFHRGFVTAFSYHPLAVQRRPNLSGPFTEDWRLIAAFICAPNRLDRGSEQQ